jgi:hypothetical protein
MPRSSMCRIDRTRREMQTVLFKRLRHGTPGSRWIAAPYRLAIACCLVVRPPDPGRDRAS